MVSKCLNAGTFLDKLEIATLQKGDPEQIYNNYYRHIFMLSAVHKTIEKAICIKLINLLYKTDPGFVLKIRLKWMH